MIDYFKRIFFKIPIFQIYSTLTSLVFILLNHYFFLQAWSFCGNPSSSHFLQSLSGKIFFNLFDEFPVSQFSSLDEFHRLPRHTITKYKQSKKQNCILKLGHTRHSIKKSLISYWSCSNANFSNFVISKCNQNKNVNKIFLRFIVSKNIFECIF